MAADNVHQGILHKLGGNVKSWTKRWMILKKDNVLYYYKDPTKSPQGSIPLSDHMFHAKEGRERDLNWPKAVGIERTIVIRTSYRIYYMYADNQKEATEWIERLQSAADNISGKKVTKRPDSKSSLPEVSVANGKSHPKTASVSSMTSNLSTSIDASGYKIDSLYDSARLPDSDCSISTDEENGQGLDDNYAVPPSSELADNIAIYEVTDDNLNHSQSSKISSKPLTSSGAGSQPVYEDADALLEAKPQEEVYEVVNDQQPPWAASRHIPPSDPPPPPPDDDDDEDTVPLPRPALPPKDSNVPPPIPNRGSASKLTNSGDDSPPAVPMKKKNAARKTTDGNHDYSVLRKIDKPQMSASPPPMMQRSRIDSAGIGTISPTEIDSLKYEPEEDSEEFYVDMAANDNVNEDEIELKAQRELEKQKQLEEERQKFEEEQQRECEIQRQRKLEEQRQQEAKVEIQRQRKIELQQQELEDVASQNDITTQLNGVELEARRQAEYEARMRKEMEEKKKERLDYLTSKSKSTLAVNDTDDAKKKRSGTNMFKAQRNRLVESVDTEKETSGGKPNTGAWLQMEREKTLMQEERLKLEREKRQFEEEREKFEREKRQMRMEMARLKQ